MPFALKPRWRFIDKAAREEFKRSRWYKIVSLATIAFTILNFLSLFGLKIPLPAPSWKLATFFLVSIVVALLLVIEAVYRYHRRTISSLYAEAQKSVQIVTRLMDVAGQGYLLDSMYHEKENDIPKRLLENWLSGLRGALQDSFGPTAISDFTNGHPEYLNVVPDERHIWFLDLRHKLSEQIGYQTTLIKQAKSAHEQLGA